jgi:hypothetical protein
MQQNLRYMGLEIFTATGNNNISPGEQNRQFPTEVQLSLDRLCYFLMMEAKKVSEMIGFP